MASTLRLTGNAGGNVIVSANDTITTDQTFEFPDNGGTLLTGSQTNTGSGGSSGSAQVVGYQYGGWTPTVVSSINYGSSLTANQTVWARVGRTVTIWCRMKPDASGNATLGDELIIKGLPYDIDTNDPNNATFFGSQSGSSTVNTQHYCTCYFTSGETRITFRPFNINGATPRDLSLRAQFSYITNNTDWTPGNSATVS